MLYLMGIDDTDNLESRGTGHRARQLAEFLSQKQLAIPKAITRHQLLVSPEIPYTSHNSSACLRLEVDPTLEEQTWNAASEFLLAESAPGSDAGICLASWEVISQTVCAYGTRAKTQVLTQADALQTASQHKIRLQGLTGTRGGIIGSLAGVGLHRAGNDGRYLWLPGMREISGDMTVAEICAQASIDQVCTLDGTVLSQQTLVHLGDWVRPILRGGQATLFIEEREHEWYIISKDKIKNLSN